VPEATGLTTAAEPPPDAIESPLRRDLHWLAAQFKHGLATVETAIVRRHGMSLWGYTVLVEVASGPTRSQLALAGAVPVDKTKLVAILDELESAGLVTRLPDPRDRRARLVEPTASGRATLADATTEIRSVENELLVDLDAEERAAFLHALQRVIVVRLEQLVSGAATVDTNTCG
jgi:DNA-binding MarR family transcriptional regulator